MSRERVWILDVEITEGHLEDWLALASWLFVATLVEMKISDKEL